MYDVVIVTADNCVVESISYPWIFSEVWNRKEDLERELNQKLYAVAAWGLMKKASLV